MIKTKKELKEFLNYEKTQYSLNKFSGFLALFGASEHGLIWKFQKRLRKLEYHLNQNHKFRTAYYRFLKNRLGYKIGFSIHPNCFDKGLKIMHIGKILVNENSKIGKNCVVHINSSLIATNGVKAGPQLGDDCKIGVGAILIGGIHIADGIAIGAGSVVTKSFEEKNITIAGNPAKKISDKGVM